MCVCVGWCVYFDFEVGRGREVIAGVLYILYRVYIVTIGDKHDVSVMFFCFGLFYHERVISSLPQECKRRLFYLYDR